ncbi:MAG: sulfotransferase [Fuerstiella sp.]
MIRTDQSANNTDASLPQNTQEAPAACAYIAGSGRSGSTFLGLQLERSPDICFAGELTYLWERGLQQNQLCGCGQPFRECEFWQAVLQEAFGRLSPSDVAEAVRLRKRISVLTGLMPLRIGRNHVDSNSAEMYAQKYDALVTAIRKVSGCQVVVDSSKYPTDLAALIRGGIALCTIQLVRDCRAVVYSWRRKKQRTEIHWRRQLMPRYGALQTALAWKHFNSAVHDLAAADDKRYRLLRYEDIMSDFATELSGLTEWLRCRSAHGAAAVSTGHSVSGNPCRFEFDPGRIRPDLEWQTHISVIDRCIVAALCGRQQKMYGY